MNNKLLAFITIIPAFSGLLLGICTIVIFSIMGMLNVVSGLILVICCAIFTCIEMFTMYKVYKEDLWKK